MNVHSVKSPPKAARRELLSPPCTPQSNLRGKLSLLAACLFASLFVLAATPTSTPRTVASTAYDYAAVVGDTNTPRTGDENAPSSAGTLVYDYAAVVGLHLASSTTTDETTPEPKPKPTPEPTPTPTPEPTPEPTPMPASHYKQQLLELINQARSEADLAPLTLAENPLPQQQAESALENCLFSNWGLDGLKPYMRFSLNGDYQANGEIVAAYGSCSPSETTRWADGDSVVFDVIARWRTSSLDWQNNVLEPWYSKVSVGLAWNDDFYAVHLHFERDYIEFSNLPSINDDGILSLEGALKNGVSLPRSSDLLIDVYYDPPPRSLTRGQLGATNCYVYGNTGFLAAALRPPPPSDYSYPDDTLTIDYVLGCTDPYDVPSDTPAPTGFLETPSVSLSMNQGVADWITARTWNVSDDSFSVIADLGSLIDELGPGVYTVLIWAVADSGDDVLVGTYSIFVDTPTPTLNTAP